MSEQERKENYMKVMEQHKGIVWKVANTYCRDENDKQDLIQEISVQIWQALPKYNQEYNLTTFLYRICLNVAISYQRKRRVRADIHTSLNEAASLVPSTDSAERIAQIQLLNKFIAELKEIDKALMLLYLEDKTHHEIAGILGISVSNVGTRIGRIKAALKQKFNQ